MKQLYLSHFTATSCIGRGLAHTLDSVRNGKSGLTLCSFDTVDLKTYIGEVAGVDETIIRSDLKTFDCRNNRLLQRALEQDGFSDAVSLATEKYGRERIGVFIGTSTSGSLQTELAYRRRDPTNGALPPDFNYAHTHNSFSPTDFTRRYFDLAGPRNDCRVRLFFKRESI